MTRQLISEKEVRGLTDPGSLERGRELFRSDAIMDAVQEGNELFAQCVGSGGNVYQLHITLSENRIADYECTCPRGDFCKHLVALALTYIHQPDRFVKRPPLEDQINQMTKEELVSLIKTIVAHFPPLRAMVGALTDTASPDSLNTNAIQGQIHNALRRSTQWQEDELSSVYLPITHRARQYSTQGKWVYAGKIYQAVIEELIADRTTRLYHSMDLEIVFNVMQDAIEGLVDCFLELPPGDPTRKQWVQTLWDVLQFDMKVGGFVETTPVEETLVHQTSAEEWQMIEPLIQKYLRGGEKWYTEMLVEMLEARYTHDGREEDRTDLILRHGSVLRRVVLLLETGKRRAAMRIAQKEIHPLEIDELVRELLERGWVEEAVEVVGYHESYIASKNPSLLVDVYRKVGKPQEALEMQKRVFLGSLRTEAYKTLRALAQETGNWEEVRAFVLQELERKREFMTLTDIAIEEGDIQRAVQMLEKVKPRRNTLDYYRYIETRRFLAEQAEKKFPEDSIRLYLEEVEDRIDRQNRAAYAEAAQILKVIRRLYKRMKREGEWQELIASLREKYRSRRALQDELNKAKL